MPADVRNVRFVFQVSPPGGHRCRQQETEGPAWGREVRAPRLEGGLRRDLVWTLVCPSRHRACLLFRVREALRRFLARGEVRNPLTL